ncbi:hypothetical protein ACK3TF_000961 [Chlorella vulgaris]
MRAASVCTTALAIASRTPRSMRLPSHQPHGIAASQHWAGRRHRHGGGTVVAKRSHVVRVVAIGFDLGAQTDNQSAEKAAEALTRGAASLLLYSSSLKSKPAQAFLGVLSLLQKGNPLLLIQQHGELCRLLAADGYTSWEDCLLDQIIKGSDNALARAAATGKPTAHLLAAAAHDLDVLQQLAVSEHTLALWVKETSYGVTEEWLQAANSMTRPAASGGNGTSNGAVTGAVPESLLDSGAPPPPALLKPLSEAQRAALRAHLAAQPKWSQNVDLLAHYYGAHGFGLVSQHSVLTWVGKLQAQDVLKGAHRLEAAVSHMHISDNNPAYDVLVEGLTAFLQQDLSQSAAPPHVALCGCPAARWLMTCLVLQGGLESAVPAELAAAAAGLRVLLLPATQISSLPELAWSLSQQPRARFVVIVNGLESGNSTADHAAMLSGFDGFSWPSNAMLLAGFASKAPIALFNVFASFAEVDEDEE